MRLATTFAKIRPALVCFLTAGDGDTAANLDALIAGGADVIELGMPKKPSPLQGRGLGEGWERGSRATLMRDPELTKRAREMRKVLTEPELRLWHQLRAERFAGVKFRRQKVIQDEHYRAIVDFATNDPKLVIEVDGETHVGLEGRDAARTGFLESKGYRVVRFTNAEVMGNLDGVLVGIGEVIEELRMQPPLPTLSPEGERAL